MREVTLDKVRISSSLDRVRLETSEVRVDIPVSEVCLSELYKVTGTLNIITRDVVYKVPAVKEGEFVTAWITADKYAKES